LSHWFDGSEVRFILYSSSSFNDSSHTLSDTSTINTSNGASPLSVSHQGFAAAQTPFSSQPSVLVEFLDG